MYEGCCNPLFMLLAVLAPKMLAMLIPYPKEKHEKKVCFDCLSFKEASVGRTTTNINRIHSLRCPLSPPPCTILVLSQNSHLSSVVVCRPPGCCCCCCCCLYLGTNSLTASQPKADDDDDDPAERREKEKHSCRGSCRSFISCSWTHLR